MPRIDLHKLAGEAKFNRFHWSVYLWACAIMMAEGYDLSVVGTALPSIMKEMAIDAKTAGMMASSALFGMMFGAIGLGMLADKIGRRWALSISVFLFSVFTAAAGATSDPVSFSVMRFLAGLGIGGAVPTTTALVTEFMPKSVRGRMLTLLGCSVAVGNLLAAIVGKQLIEVYGWQPMFFAAGLPVLLVFAISKYLPESMPFMVKKNDHTNLRRLVNKIRPGIQLEPEEEFSLPVEHKMEGSSVGKLFQDGRGFSTIMFWIVMITCMFMLYALNTWLVKLMAMAGYSLGSALTFLLVYNAGGLVGAICGGWLADKFNIKWVLFSSFMLAAISLLLLAYAIQPLTLVVGVVGASTLGTLSLAYAYTGQFYPTAIRSTGIGLASGAGRTGAILAPIGIGVLVGMNLPLVQNFVAIACVGVAGAIAVGLINHRKSASAHSADAMREDISQPQTARVLP